MEDPSKTIFEVGERLMVSPTGREPYLRIAHFLRPSINSISGPNCELPPFSPCSLPSSLKPQDWPLKVTFSCWRYRHKIWMTWVDQMASLHQSTWKKAGIFEAVMNSKYHIQKDQSLVLGITERWCSETKTFVFPWGEATVTLEDVIVLGGYSVLGDSVLSRAESEDLQEIEENLKEARRRIVATKAKKACQSLWIKTFMNSGKELEHHAFLACWLSRYVFAGVHGTISEHVFPVAIQLARGTRIALAPAVLASIYRDLSLLKEKIVVATNSKSCKDVKDGVLELTLRSPFYLIQIWVWERFLELQPKPNILNYGDLRMARWDKVNGLKVENVRLSLELAGEGFLWRPYAMAMGGWKFPKFYSEKEFWVPVGPGLDEELLSFARCMRVSELVGFGYIEQYLPHRVAMQFGMDQDLPGFVPRLNEFLDIAWNDYSKPISDEKLYIPPRLFKAGITARYLDWKQSMFDQQETSKRIVPEQRRLNGSKKSRQSLTKEKQAKDIAIPDHIPPKGSKSLEHSSIGQLQTLSCSSCQELEIPGLALEKRIIRLEKVIAELKAARFGSKFSKKSKKDVGLVASTIMYAFYLNETYQSDQLCTVPVINMKRADLSCHAEIKWLIASCLIDQSFLIFIDEALKEAVDRIFCCRKGESAHPWVETYTIGEDCSCCTLIAERFALASPEILARQGFSRLLLAGIFIETGNLTNPRCTSKDKYMATLLINGAGRFGSNVKYKMHDVSDLKIVDILHKDFKKWRRLGKPDAAGSRLMALHIGMSFIGISIAQLLAHEDASSQGIKNFQRLEKLRLLMIVSGYYDSQKNFKREILVSAESAELAKNLIFFFNSNASQLPLKVLHKPGLRDDMKVFEVDKVPSRKTIKHLLEEFGVITKS